MYIYYLFLSMVALFDDVCYTEVIVISAQKCTLKHFLLKIGFQNLNLIFLQVLKIKIRIKNSFQIFKGAHYTKIYL